MRTTRSLISTGTEMTVFNRRFEPGTHWDQWVSYPFRPGYLVAGEIIAVGEGVKDFAVGDRVAARGPHESHLCFNTADVVRIPAGVTDEQACWMGLGKITQVGVRAAAHALGDRVVVIGLGLLGQLVVQYARLSGASEVIAIDTADVRLTMAAKHGATVMLNTTADRAREQVLAATGGAGADVIYDITGHPAVLASALGLARQFGTVVLLGDTGSPSQQAISVDLITRGLRIVGAHDQHPPKHRTPGVRWSAVEICELFLQYLARKQIVVDDLVTHRFPAERGPEAYDLLNRERMTAMGVMLEWGER